MNFLTRRINETLADWNNNRIGYGEALRLLVSYGYNVNQAAHTLAR